ncbi:hypothetical protein MMO38_12175 [Acinetobacter sp. NIPH 1852]|uniref:hypothetical protein n=1 Tax=unclassified Acinetobacter TaxID=196816 RepID=UPI0002CE0676|nr:MULTISPECIES: hypothetical protein [unclassified Acinetobacter]MBP8006590.1 hypothetical protein [Acinetobacter sp.]MDR7018044.1 hypothetical protein [Prolinoborus sp. 3657]ENU31865.1 hypothetical protein F991_00179 [Acinetobacter sp. CIP-A165]ENW96871.1 hypothetical protein F903_00679 [Acinetobacter sp. NIPH 298]MCH7308878.1 hypothetical protein [Acinetobacter sp. NIPH 1852]
MNSPQLSSEHRSQQFYRQYSANALLPQLNWQTIFAQNKLNDTHLRALNTLYQAAVPLALNVFDELHFDVFAPAAYQPQGLGLFEKLAQQEEIFLKALETESSHLDQDTRHQMWSMLLRGGAVLVFKAWLGHVKAGENQLDRTQFDELSDLLFIKTRPENLAQRLKIESDAEIEHIFLMYENDVFLDHFNSLETAALFVDLGVYDAAFLSLRDDRVAEYLKAEGYVTQEQIDDLQCALNPLYCDSLMPKQDCLA